MSCVSRSCHGLGSEDMEMQKDRCSTIGRQKCKGAIGIHQFISNVWILVDIKGHSWKRALKVEKGGQSLKCLELRALAEARWSYIKMDTKKNQTKQANKQDNTKKNKHKNIKVPPS